MVAPHLLADLVLPDRYESLLAQLGPDLLRVLVEPDDGTLDSFAALSQAIRTKRRGWLVPVSARSGTGKSTLAYSLGHFLPDSYSPAVSHDGPIEAAALASTAAEAERGGRANDHRVVPIVVDDREGAPPSQGELAVLKQFCRSGGVASRSAVLWLETNTQRAETIASEYEDVAGRPPTPLPLAAGGPPPESWAAVATETLRLANGISSVEELGVDPADYNASAHPTIGDFLSAVADDFNALKRELLAALDKPTQLVVLFASGSREPGPLAQFTEGRRLGLLNGHALVGATPGTDEGRFWGPRMGALTSAILRLNARAYVLPPTTSVTALRQFGRPEVRQLLEAQGVGQADPSGYWARSDVGRFLAGAERDATEARGNPGHGKAGAFEALAGAGHFASGRDKELNAGIAASLLSWLRAQGDYTAAIPEERLLTAHSSGGNVTPDIRLEGESLRTCIEVTWRRGDYVVPKNRAAMAAYILDKIRSYASAHGWVRN